VIRSLLYVPASSERFVAKAAERGADAIILDLEDAVAPSEKIAARNNLNQTVPAVGKNGATVFVRINSEPERLRADAEAAVKAGGFGLFVPKSRDPKALLQLGQWLEPLEKGRKPTALVPMIEDPGAVLDARSIAMASPRVFALVTGGEDLATALNAEPTPEVLTLPKLLVLYAAKAAGVLCWGLLRTVADYSDLAGIERAAKEARAHGIDGSTCVHPAVVPILNKAFSASPEELDHARRLVEAYEKAHTSGLGAVEFEGKMIDEPVAQRARALLRKGNQ
jgi:citrate lyase subunit beta/citryl-CoA lyase